MAGGTAGAPAVTVAIVSFNTRELLLRCLDSLEPEVVGGLADVWVLDNASTDGSAEAARERAPWARVIQSATNLGYGNAVNLVSAKTQSEWLVCANADVVLLPGALRVLLEAGRDPDVGCVAPRLLLPDGSTQHSVYPFPTLGFTLAFNLGLPALSPRLADRLCLEGQWNAERPRRVPWAIGAFLLLRRRAFDAVGGFDARQWMYAEDLELGWRLHDAGWLTRYAPDARVRHEGAAATAPAFGATRRDRFTAATYEVIARRRGSPVKDVTAAMNLAGAAARVAWMTPLARRSSWWRERREDTRSWLTVHRRALRSITAVDSAEMRRFWNARALEDAFYFVDTRHPYGEGERDSFWHSAEILDGLLDGLHLTLDPQARVLEIGCGVGRVTRELAARVDRVIALDVSDEMLARARTLNPALENVRWMHGDGVSLTGIDDESIDACVSLVVLQHVPDPGITLGYVRELGRVLRPGGWAALQVSNDPRVHRPRNGLGWRLKALVGRAPRGQRHPAWLGSHVDLDVLRETAEAHGLAVEQVWGAGTQYCQVRLRRRPDSPA